MITYRLTPAQMTQLAFALGAAAASESDPQGVGDYIQLGNKVSQGCAIGSLAVNHRESGRLVSALNTAASALKNGGGAYGDWIGGLRETIRAGAGEQAGAAVNG